LRKRTIGCFLPIQNLKKNVHSLSKWGSEEKRITLSSGVQGQPGQYKETLLNIIMMMMMMMIIIIIISLERKEGKEERSKSLKVLGIK
jgi:hypothetical protein